MSLTTVHTDSDSYGPLKPFPPVGVSESCCIDGNIVYSRLNYLAVNLLSTSFNLSLMLTLVNDLYGNRKSYSDL